MIFWLYDETLEAYRDAFEWSEPKENMQAWFHYSINTEMKEKIVTFFAHNSDFLQFWGKNKLWLQDVNSECTPPPPFFWQ